jgi:hypothetical protein
MDSARGSACPRLIGWPLPARVASLEILVTLTAANL